MEWGASFILLQIYNLSTDKNHQIAAPPTVVVAVLGGLRPEEQRPLMLMHGLHFALACTLFECVCVAVSSGDE